MNVRARLGELAGRWTGANRLWLSPKEPARESATAASIALVARGAFATIAYTWADAGQPQDGLLIVRNAPGPSAEDMVWVDSWHTGGKFMHFRGAGESQERLSAFGTYAAPPGPDWGWRIELAAERDDGLLVLMYNVSPDGDEALAVEARYARVDRAAEADGSHRPPASD